MNQILFKFCLIMYCFFVLFLQANVEKALNTQGIEAANQLVRDGKKHGPSYLIGRLIRKKQEKPVTETTSRTFSVPDDYVSDLTAKIRDQLEQEMNEKLDQKVREMIKKLVDKNPDLNMPLDDSENSPELSIESQTLSSTCHGFAEKFLHQKLN